MKQSISAIDLRYLVRESQLLASAKVEKIYHPQKKELVFQLHLPGTGKKMLRMILPDFIYMTEFKGNYPERPSGFCMFLRKRLNNARIRRIEQKGFERILEIEFETKEAKYLMIVELFSKGNVVLCDMGYNIVGLLEVQFWKDREVKPKARYVFPERIDISKAGLEEFRKALDTKKQAVKVLAADMGLGGVYAEEAFAISGVDKDKASLDEKESKKLFDAVKKLLDKAAEPMIIYSDEEVKDITPFGLSYYSNMKSEKLPTFNECFDRILTESLKTEIKEEHLFKHNTKLDKLQKIVNMQSGQVEKMKQEIEEANKKAETLFNNYKLVEEIIKQVKEEMKRSNLNEMKAKLKDKPHKILKDIIPKDKKVVVEL